MGTTQSFIQQKISLLALEKRIARMEVNRRGGDGAQLFMGKAWDCKNTLKGKKLSAADSDGNRTFEIAAIKDSAAAPATVWDFSKNAAGELTHSATKQKLKSLGIDKFKKLEFVYKAGPPAKGRIVLKSKTSIQGLMERENKAADWELSGVTVTAKTAAEAQTENLSDGAGDYVTACGLAATAKESCGPGIAGAPHANGGGFVATTAAATVESTAFIGPDAAVCGNAQVKSRARVYGNAKISGNAEVIGQNSLLDGGNAEVYGNAKISGDAKVKNKARVYGNAEVYGNAQVIGSSRVYGYAKVYGNSWVMNNARVYENAVVFGAARVYGDAQVYDRAWVAGSPGNSVNFPKVYGYAKVSGTARVRGNAEVYDNARVSGNAQLQDYVRVYEDAFFGSGSANDNAKVRGFARISGGSVSGAAKIYDFARISGGSVTDSRVHGNAKISGNAQITGGSAEVFGNAEVSSNAKVDGARGVMLVCGDAKLKGRATATYTPGGSPFFTVTTGTHTAGEVAGPAHSCPP